MLLTRLCSQKMYPALELAEGEDPSLIDDLLEIDMAVIMSKVRRKDPFRNRYGWLPQLWECYAAGNTASSFCESSRMISVANDVMTEGRTLLDDPKLEMPAILRMNREFMEYMRAEFPEMMNELVSQGLKEVEQLMRDSAMATAATAK